MRIIRTTNPNGTYRYELDGEVMYKASKVLYTHASSYTVGDADTSSPVLFHKTEAAALRARGYQGWVKTGMQAIEDGDATATVAQHALTIATLAAVLMEQGRLRVSKGLSSGAITTTLDIARGNEATRAAGIALAHGHDSDIREAFKTSVPPAMAPVVDEPAPAPRVDLWETHEGVTHAYDTDGHRVIEISERVRDTRWTVATNVRHWTVLGDGITRHGVLASGTADGLRAAKRAALAAWADIMATPAPEPRKAPRNRAKVVPNQGAPTHLVGRQGRVLGKHTGDDGKLYVDVDFGEGGEWPFLVHELDVV